MPNSPTFFTGREEAENFVGKVRMSNWGISLLEINLLLPIPPHLYSLSLLTSIPPEAKEISVSFRLRGQNHVVVKLQKNVMPDTVKEIKESIIHLYKCDGLNYISLKFLC